MFLSHVHPMKGRLQIQQFDRAGHLVTAIEADNAIVYTGRELVAKLFIQVDNIKPISHIAIGTDETPVDPGKDTALGRQVFRKALRPFEQKDLTDNQVDVTDRDGNPQRQRSSIIRLSADLDFDEPSVKDNGGRPYNLKEAGLFNDAEGGVMYNRVVFPGISKTADFKLTLVWEIIF